MRNDGSISIEDLPGNEKKMRNDEGIPIGQTVCTGGEIRS